MYSHAAVVFSHTCATVGSRWRLFDAHVKSDGSTSLYLYTRVWDEGLLLIRL